MNAHRETAGKCSVTIRKTREIPDPASQPAVSLSNNVYRNPLPHQALMSQMMREEEKSLNADFTGAHVSSACGDWVLS